MNYDVFIIALTIWREAAGEGEIGWRAVLHVILKRARLKWRGADGAAEVCTDKAQFSAMTIAGDATTVKWPRISDTVGWKVFNDIIAMIHSPGEDPTGGADHYHSTRIPVDKLPKWALKNQGKVTKVIGRHKFYRLLEERDVRDPGVPDSGFGIG